MEAGKEKYTTPALPVTLLQLSRAQGVGGTLGGGGVDGREALVNITVRDTDSPKFRLWNASPPPTSYHSITKGLFTAVPFT